MEVKDKTGLSNAEEDQSEEENERVEKQDRKMMYEEENIKEIAEEEGDIKAKFRTIVKGLANLKGFSYL